MTEQPKENTPPGLTSDDIPPDLWQACSECSRLIYAPELVSELWVCSKCGHHMRLSVWQRLQITVDADSFEEWDHDLPLNDPLHFPEYLEKARQAREKTGMTEAVLTGRATLDGIALGIGLMDLSFIGGSMGWTVGERVTRLMERAIQQRLPVVMFCASGGARMQESLIALMQMAKTSAAAGRLAQAGLPYISVLTHPTYGGVTASFAFLGDVIIAEAGAAMGFAGPRVVELTGLKMPPGVQTAEYQYEHGMIDMLLERKQIRPTLHTILRWCTD
jgi:acetyl-CoA carboxylase carboxyl transferase beta subunit